MSEAPLSIQLEHFVPAGCVGCETASEECAKMARNILGGQLTFDDAGTAISQKFQECNGRVERHASWGTLAASCQYVELPTRSTRNLLASIIEDFPGKTIYYDGL